MTCSNHRLSPVWRLHVRRKVHYRSFPGSVSGKRETPRRSPWLPPFSPPSPQDGPCSKASSILWGYPTSHRRRWQDYGFPSLPRPTFLRRAPMRSPSSCASNFPACSGSPTAWNLRRTRVLRPASFCLPLAQTASTFQIYHFAAPWLACRCPLSTLRYTPRDVQRMTRGQDGSLLLSCIGLSPTITCQFVLAHLG